MTLLNQPQNCVSNESRRKFLKHSAFATGGLVLGISLPNKVIAGVKMDTDSTFNPNAFIMVFAR